MNLRLRSKNELERRFVPAKLREAGIATEVNLSFDRSLQLCYNSSGDSLQVCCIVVTVINSLHMHCNCGGQPSDTIAGHPQLQNTSTSDLIGMKTPSCNPKNDNCQKLHFIK